MKTEPEAISCKPATQQYTCFSICNKKKPFLFFLSTGIGRNGESEKSNQSTKQEVLTKSADEVRRSVFAPEVRSPCDDHAPRRYETRALRCNEFFNVFRINQ